MEDLEKRPINDNLPGKSRARRNTRPMLMLASRTFRGASNYRENREVRGRECIFQQPRDHSFDAIPGKKDKRKTATYGS
jgi:hypothetical protein